MFDWVQNIADFIVYNTLELSRDSKLADALNFFIYDSIKILILITVIIFLMGIINSYFPVEKVRNFLSRNKLYGLEYLMASYLLGFLESKSLFYMCLVVLFWAWYRA